MICNICPRQCGADRAVSVGYCGVGEAIRVNKIMRHCFEEPCIGGEAGAGAIFFVGCNLRCVFCQNGVISTPGQDLPGEDMTPEELATHMLNIQKAGLSSVDLVTPTQFTHKIAEALRTARERGLNLPVVWNSGGYESAEALKEIAPYIDVYMPDFKYFSSDISKKFSAAEDYSQKTAEAVKYMYSVLGKARFDASGIMTRGILVRHLVLPGCRHDSCAVLDRLAETVEPQKIRLSLMSQYSPEFYKGDDKALRRRITSFEYESVLSYAEKLGFDGYMQARSSSGNKYTPDFGRQIKIDPGL